MKNTLLKKTLSIVTLLALLLSFCACALASKSDNNADGGYSPNASLGYYDGSLSGESYTEITENDFVNTAEKPSSYFSIDANTASYPNLRSLIKQGATSVPKDAVRVEEMLNYFDYDYDTPYDGAILSLTSSVFDTPYNTNTKLLTIGLAAKEVEFSEVRNNLVFLIDVSGSMYSDDKLPLVQQSFMMLVENLNQDDLRELAARMDDYMDEFERNGIDNLSIENAE